MKIFYYIVLGMGILAISCSYKNKPSTLTSETITETADSQKVNTPNLATKTETTTKTTADNKEINTPDISEVSRKTSTQSGLQDSAKSVLLGFLKVIDAAEIATSEAMLEASKQKLIESDLAVYADKSKCEGLTEEERFDVWFVGNAGRNFIWLYQCGDIDESVRLKVYPKNNGGYLIGNVAVLGNSGQSHNFSFYNLTEDFQWNKIAGKDSADYKQKFAELGLIPTFYNDFLTPEYYFAAEANNSVPLWATDDGIIAEPWTWNESDWEFRPLSREFWFAWNGQKFVRRQKEIAIEKNK